MSSVYQHFSPPIHECENNVPELNCYLRKFENVRKKFFKYSEEITPRPALSNSMYICVGRMKFYPDGMLYMYLEVSLNPKHPDSIWPVNATWKVEALNEHDPSKQFSFGENSFIFNKPKQGFASHPNDWIAVNIEKLESSQMIDKDGSMTIRWSVKLEPTPEFFSVKQFKELLLQTQFITEGFSKVSQISELCRTNTAEITTLQQSVRNISDCCDKTLMKVEQLNSQMTLHSNQIFTLDKDMKAFNNNAQVFEKNTI